MTDISFIRDGLMLFFQLYYYILLGRIIASFFQGSFYRNPALSQLYRLLYGLTEPLLAPLRRVIPPVSFGAGYLDLSPVALLILLRVVQQLVFQYL